MSKSSDLEFPPPSNNGQSVVTLTATKSYDTPLEAVLRAIPGIGISADSIEQHLRDRGWRDEEVGALVGALNIARLPNAQ